MRRAILLATLSITAVCFAGFTGTAHAATFSCTDTGSLAAPFGYTGGVSGHGLEVTNSGITCTGGSTNGWDVKLTVQFKSSSGAWDFADQTNGNTTTVNIPSGADDCNAIAHFGNGVSEPVTALFGPVSAGGVCPDGSVHWEAANVDDIWNSNNTYDFTTHGLCSNGVQGWRIRYIYTDYGGTGSQTSYSDSSTC